MFLHIVRSVAFSWLCKTWDIWFVEPNFMGHGGQSSLKPINPGLSQESRDAWCPWLYINIYPILHGAESLLRSWFAGSQEIPRISRNPKVHYRTHKRPPSVSILGQPNPVHIPTSRLLEIHPNVIHPSTPRSPQWSLSLRFPHQDPIHPLSSPIYATCPAHLILLDFITRTILGEEYRSFSYKHITVLNIKLHHVPSSNISLIIP